MSAKLPYILERADIQLNKLYHINNTREPYLTEYGGDKVAEYCREISIEICQSKWEGEEYIPPRSIYIEDRYYLTHYIGMELNGEKQSYIGGGVYLNSPKEEFTLKGKLVTRIAQFFWKVYGYKLTTEQKTKLGNLISKFTFSEKDVYIDFVNYIDWNAGEFGEHDKSCWWNPEDYRNHYIGRLMFEEEMHRNRAFAVRLFRRIDITELVNYRRSPLTARFSKFYYNQYAPFGRCWLIPYEHNEAYYGWNYLTADILSTMPMGILMNGYGMDTQAIAVCLRSLLMYEQISDIKVKLTEPIYINGGENSSKLIGDVEGDPNGRTRPSKYTNEEWCTKMIFPSHHSFEVPEFYEEEETYEDEY